MKIKRKTILNRRNNQLSVTLPSKLIKELGKSPKYVFIEIDNSILRKKVSRKKHG